MRFGPYIRMVREMLKEKDARYSVRQLARRVGVEPAYLSKVERELVPPPSEATIRRLATELRADPDVLLAMGGKVSQDLLEIIRRRPQLFATMLRLLDSLPDPAVRGLLAGAMGKKAP